MQKKRINTSRNPHLETTAISENASKKKERKENKRQKIQKYECIKISI